MLRKAVYAGTWYPTEKKQIEEYLNLKTKREPAVAAVCPHAGWIYSGKVAGEVYSKVTDYDTYILIGPNHTGAGSPVSIFSEGSWQMPLGEVQIDQEIAGSIIPLSEFMKAETSAHTREHCLEVQIPFIQYFNPSAKIVPIILRAEELEICYDVSNAITTALKKISKKVLIIASTDMTHYEPYELAKKQDKLAIDMMLQLDAQGLAKIVIQRGISMCGVFPAATVVLVAKNMGAKKCELIKYATSGDVSGDYDSVVGYAGIIIK